MAQAMERAEAERLDAADPIAGLRDRFVIEDEGQVYLVGNSLGRLPRATVPALEAAVREGWGRRLVGAWHDWIEVGQEVGDRLGEALLGAAPGQVTVSDSTTVNLYKLASAALDARPGRRAVLSTADNFPTDRYVLEGLAAARGLELRLLDPAPEGGAGPAGVEAALGPDVALVSLSHVSYLSGAIEDVAAITAAAHEAGALVLWDLCHSAGAVPVELDAWGVDLAVGCTYKYVNAGPGAPAFLYVRRELQERLRQPIWGWWGQRDQFAMGRAYDPAPSIARYLAGTPPVLSVLPVRVGVDVLAEAGLDRLRAKSVALTELLVRLWEAWLAPLGFRLASPRDPERRGGHVALAHPEGYRVSQALLAAGVAQDFRPPDLLRLAPAAAYTRFVDVWDGMDRLRRLVDTGEHLAFGPRPGRVTGKGPQGRTTVAVSQRTSVRIEPSPRWVRAVFNNVTVADSKRPLLVWERMLPEYYFPREDVRTDLLTEAGERHDPGVGHARLFTVRVGDRVAERAARSREEQAAGGISLAGYLAFDWNAMDRWYEEDDEVFVHPRDPHHRVDVLRSSRHVRVEMLGEVVAETRRPLLLFETGLPTRYYIPPTDVRLDLLRPSDTRTQCPYKGVASYHSIQVGDRLARDLVWYYPFPIPECPKIEGMLAFYNEKVDRIVVDGEELPKPRTPWAKPPEIETVA